MGASGEKRAQAIASLSDITEVERRFGNLVRRVWIVKEYDCHDRCAFDKETCQRGKGGWHGIGSRRIYWSVAVLGVGAVSFELSTPIYTENALLRGGPRLASIVADWTPLGGLDLHYGTPPDYLKDWSSPQPCHVLDGECWGDVTFLSSDAGFDAYMAGGTPGVWSWLAETRLPDVVNVCAPGGPTKEADHG